MGPTARGDRRGFVDENAMSLKERITALSLAQLQHTMKRKPPGGTRLVGMTDLPRSHDEGNAIWDMRSIDWPDTASWAQWPAAEQQVFHDEEDTSDNQQLATRLLIDSAVQRNVLTPRQENAWVPSFPQSPSDPSRLLDKEVHELDRIQDEVARIRLQNNGSLLPEMHVSKPNQSPALLSILKSSSAPKLHQTLSHSSSASEIDSVLRSLMEQAGMYISGSTCSATSSGSADACERQFADSDTNDESTTECSVGSGAPQSLAAWPTSFALKPLHAAYNCKSLYNNPPVTTRSDNSSSPSLMSPQCFAIDDQDATSESMTMVSEDVTAISDAYSRTHKRRMGGRLGIACRVDVFQPAGSLSAENLDIYPDRATSSSSLSHPEKIAASGGSSSKRHAVMAKSTVNSPYNRHSSTSTVPSRQANHRGEPCDALDLPQIALATRDLDVDKELEAFSVSDVLSGTMETLISEDDHEHLAPSGSVSSGLVSANVCPVKPLLVAYRAGPKSLQETRRERLLARISAGGFDQLCIEGGEDISTCASIPPSKQKPSLKAQREVQLLEQEEQLRDRQQQLREQQQRLTEQGRQLREQQQFVRNYLNWGIHRVELTLGEQRDGKQSHDQDRRFDEQRTDLDAIDCIVFEPRQQSVSIQSAAKVERNSRRNKLLYSKASDILKAAPQFSKEAGDSLEDNAMLSARGRTNSPRHRDYAFESASKNQLVRQRGQSTSNSSLGKLPPNSMSVGECSGSESSFSDSIGRQPSGITAQIQGYDAGAATDPPNPDPMGTLYAKSNNVCSPELELKVASAESKLNDEATSFPLQHARRRICQEPPNVLNDACPFPEKGIEREPTSDANASKHRRLEQRNRGNNTLKLSGLSEEVRVDITDPPNGENQALQLVRAKIDPEGLGSFGIDEAGVASTRADQDRSDDGGRSVWTADVFANLEDFTVDPKSLLTSSFQTEPRLIASIFPPLSMAMSTNSTAPPADKLCRPAIEDNAIEDADSQKAVLEGEGPSTEMKPTSLSVWGGSWASISKLKGVFSGSATIAPVIATSQAAVNGPIGQAVPKDKSRNYWTAISGIKTMGSFDSLTHSSVDDRLIQAAITSPLYDGSRPEKKKISAALHRIPDITETKYQHLQPLGYPPPPPPPPPGHLSNYRRERPGVAASSHRSDFTAKFPPKVVDIPHADNDEALYDMRPLFSNDSDDLETIATGQNTGQQAASEPGCSFFLCGDLSEWLSSFLSRPN